VQMGQYWEADLWRKPISDKYEQCIDRDKSYKCKLSLHLSIFSIYIIGVKLFL
jgi:hypothetical protein